MSVAAKLTLDAAAGRVWDAIVVGAGPAGAMAARELALRDFSVLLVDRAQFPRYKVCGGCLNPRSLRFLQQAGLGELTTQLGAVHLTGLRLGARGRFASVHLPTGAGVSRESLDVALVEAAIAAGVSFLPATAASLVHTDGGDSRRLHLRQVQSADVSARVVLGAVGLGGKLEHASTDAELPAHAWNAGSRVGAGVMLPSVPPGYEPHVIYMACAREGYVGQVVVEHGRWEVAAALDPLAVKSAGGAGNLAQIILEQAGFPRVPDLSELPWKGTPHLTREATRLGGERLFLLGDAAGYIEPFTGEGMAWAFAGAAAVAPLATRTIQTGWNSELLKQWRSTYRRSVTSRQFVCRLTAGMLRRPWATRLMVQGLSAFPWLARPFLTFMYRQ